MRLTTLPDVGAWLASLVDNILSGAARVAAPAGDPVASLALAGILGLVLLVVVEHVAPRFAPDDDPFRYTESE